MNKVPALRVVIWTILPPVGPGLTRDEISEAVIAQGRTLNGQTMDLILTGLRQVSALRSDARVPRRYWRGVATQEDVAGGEDRREPWTGQQITDLHRYWSQDPVLSTAAIGRLIGKSKNSIITKSRLEGLPRRDSPIMPGAAPVVPRGITGSEALPAGHPLTWPLIAAHTPCIPQGWPG